MHDVQIAKDIYWIGVNDRTTDLFEGVWPIGEVGGDPTEQELQEGVAFGRKFATSIRESRQEA